MSDCQSNSKLIDSKAMMNRPFHFIYFVCMSVAKHIPQHAGGGQRKACGNHQVTASTTWVPAIELRSSALVCQVSLPPEPSCQPDEHTV